MTATLDIVNYLLSVVDESPVSDPASDHPTVQSALIVINRVNKQVQTRGWWFNTEYNFTLNPDNLGNIILPSNVLKVIGRKPFTGLVKRGDKLYDPSQHTFEIAATVQVDMKLLLALDDIPETAVQYIQHKSAYDFYVNDDGDESKSNRLLKNSNDAWGALNQEELSVSADSALNRPQTLRLRLGIQPYGNAYGGNPSLPGGRAF